MQITQRTALPTAPTPKVAPTPTPQKQPDMVEGNRALGTAATTPSSMPEKSEDALSPKFAALARREKAIQDKDNWLKTELKKIETQREEIRNQAQAEIRGRLKQDPFGLLSEEGLTIEQLLTLQGNQPSPEAQKITELEARLSKITEDGVENQKRNYDAARKQAITDVSRIVQGSEEFEVIKALGLEEQVVIKLENAYKENGVLPDYESVCKEVEEEYFPMALEISKLSKIQKALAPAQAPAEQAIPQPGQQKQVPIPQKQPTPMTTLSNRQAPSSGKGLSWPERRARAIAIAEGRAV